MGTVETQHPNSMKIYLVLIVALVGIGMAAAFGDELEDRQRPGKGGKGKGGGGAGLLGKALCKGFKYFETDDADTRCNNQVPDDDSSIMSGTLADMCLNAAGEPEPAGTEKCFCVGVGRGRLQRFFGKRKCLTCKMTATPSC